MSSEAPSEASVADAGVGLRRPREGSLSDLRERNLARVMLAMTAGSPVTREQIEKSTRIRPTSLTALVDDLKSRGLVREEEAVQLARRGRPTRPLSLSPERWLLLGLILDGHVIRAELSLLTLQSVCTREVPVAVGTPPEEYLQVLRDVIAWAGQTARSQGRRVLAIEAAAPGATSRSTGEVLRALPNGWEHLELVPALRRFVAADPDGIHPTAAVNIDRIANYSMLARLHDDLRGRLHESEDHADTTGPTPSPTVYFGGRSALTGGLHQGDTFYGATGLAGEYGHLVVDPDGARCWCGRTGCLETKIGLLTLHRRRFDSRVSLGRLAAQGPRMLAELTESRDRGDDRTLALLREGGRWLAVAIDTIASVVNPRHVVIDGFLAALGDPLVSAAASRIDRLRGFPAIGAITLTVTDGDPSWVMRGTLVAALRTVAQTPLLALESVLPPTTTSSLQE